MKIFLVTIAIVVVFVRAQDVLPKCGTCRPEECVRQFGCVAGMVKDRCGCCDVCGNREGMRCDREEVFKVNPQKSKYGRCGDNLQCKAHPESTTLDSFHICYCKHKEIVCGSNGKTYKNICQLKADEYRHGRKFSVSRVGPCPSAPWINTPPRSMNNLNEDNIVLSCEVTGYPSPLIEWFKTVDGELTVLPGDDKHVAVQSRGGPDKNQVTGWLQIEGLRKTDAAEYTCNAKNGYGQVNAKATITLSPHFIAKIDAMEENEVFHEEDEIDTDFDDEEEEQIIPTEDENATMDTDDNDTENVDDNDTDDVADADTGDAEDTDTGDAEDTDTGEAEDDGVDSLFPVEEDHGIVGSGDEQ